LFCLFFSFFSVILIHGAHYERLSVVAHGSRRPVANAAHRVERQPFGARVLPSEQRSVLRLGAGYEFLARERVRKTAHVQALDVTVPVDPNLTLEGHPLFTGVRRPFRFRIVSVLFLRVVVQVLGWRWWWRSGSHGCDQRCGPRRTSPQYERLPRRGRRKGGGGRLSGDRRESIVRLKRQSGIREWLEGTRLERRRLERRRLERNCGQLDGRLLRLRRLPVRLDR